MSYGDLDPDRPLAKLALELPAILAAAEYNEMYGVELQAAKEGTSTPHTTLLILQKFLRANANDVTAAKTQLTEALEWRKTYKPLEALQETFPAAKFAGLGYITSIAGTKETQNDTDIVSFNIYGAAASKDPKVVFGDTDAFVRWRVAFMELTLSRLNLSSATQTIPDYGQGPDPYQAIQVHDYLSISFFRPPAEIKASSSKIIALFQKYYPETVSYKYFVNVPTIMSWVMALMKGVMSKDSVQKMTWMTTGAELKNYLGDGDDVPVEYGGKGKPLSEVGATVKYDDGSSETATATTTVPVAATSEPEQSKAPSGDVAPPAPEGTAAEKVTDPTVK